MDSVQYKRPSLWNPDSKAEHQAEYLKRLTQLRASLIGQEKSNLAHALQRFRLSSSMSTSSSSRSRDSRPGLPRRRLLSTYEQFKLMRPVKPPLFVFPLEGRQLLEPMTSPKPDSGGKRSGRKKQNLVDETVKINLQRMRNSSLPASTRTVLKVNEFVLDTSSIGTSSTLNSSRYLGDSSFGSRSKSSNSESLTVGSFSKNSERSDERPKSYAGMSFPPLNILHASEHSSMFRTHLKVKTTQKTLGLGRENQRENNEPMYVFPRIQPTGIKSFKHSKTNSKKRDGGKPKAPEENTNRKYIRVDMPTICNCTTPDMDESIGGSSDTGTLENGYSQRSFQDELQSLIDDVKKFNSRTDTLVHF